MKKRNVLSAIWSFLWSSPPSPACSSTRTHESTGEYVDDSTITTKVKTLLAEDDFLKSFQIGVETYKGRVQLSGSSIPRRPSIKRVKSPGASKESHP